MEKITLPLKDDIENLNMPPHTVPQLMDMILGEQLFSPAQQLQAWDHLAVCVQCQTFLAHYLYEVIAYNKEHAEPEEPALGLLTKLTAIMHTTLKQDIPAYVETLEQQGKDVADRRFPLFAEHMLTCQSCQLAVKNLYEWLRYSEQ